MYLVTGGLWLPFADILRSKVPMNDQKSATPSDPIVPILLLFGGLAVLLAVLVAPMTGKRQVSPTMTPLPSPTLIQPTTVAVVVYDPITVSAGEQIFQSTCAACHGFNAMGIPGLGKPLIGSQFAMSLSDDDLVAFITRGRDVTDPLNTTGVMMPAKGGNAALSDINLHEVVAYIRRLNGAQMVSAPVASTQSQPAEVAAQPSATPPAPLIANATPVAVGTPALIQGELNLSAMSGEQAYLWSCSGCHGMNGEGVPNVGPGLSDSDLLDTTNGIALVEFLTEGRPFADPRETYPHPARGGNPQLTDEQIRSLLAYLYGLP
jgi:mono/diheme cytochrome c family protein